jgi:holo-[acyl-carrier protein] synthase
MRHDEQVIVGLGIDVVDVDRFEETMRRTPGLRTRLFTDAERDRPIASLAARFAAKEALAKALGAPVGLQWQDAEVVTDGDGRPWLSVRGTVADQTRRLGVTNMHLSISHDAGIASAVVVLEGACPADHHAGEPPSQSQAGDSPPDDTPGDPPSAGSDHARSG